MQVSLICVVLLAAASSVLSYDTDIDSWIENRVADKRAEERMADKRSQRIQLLKSLVSELDALERDENQDKQQKGQLLDILNGLPLIGSLTSILNGIPLVNNLLQCVPLTAVNNVVNQVVTCLPALPASRFHDRQLAQIGLPVVGNVVQTLQCLLGGINNILTSVLNLVTGLVNSVTCALGLVPAGPALNNIQNCLSGLVNAGLSATALVTAVANCVNNLLSTLQSLGLPIPIPSLIQLPLVG